MLNVLNNTPVAVLPDSLTHQMNIDNWLMYWAAHNLFVNLDSYIGSGHNYYLYHHTEYSNFYWITWDVNEAFGNFNMGMSVTQLENLPFAFIPMPAQNRPAMSRLLSSTYIKESLAAYLCQFLETFNSEHFDPRIDALADLIRPHVYTDNYKPFSNQMFEQNLSQNVVLPGGPGGGNVAGLKSFVSARFNSLKQQFAAYTWCWLATEEPQHLTDVQLWPNPGSDNFEISCTAGMNEIAVFDATGRVVYRETPGNATTATIDVRHWSPGVYLINVWSGYEVVKRKFIKVH